MNVFPREYLTQLIGEMRERSIAFDAGLTRAEIARVETLHAFSFPPDLRSLLEFALPTGASFPEWRQPESPALAERLRWPLGGLCFDIEHNAFWQQAWGPRPPDLENAFARARLAVSRAPVLIPIFSHRYLPARPIESGNPVLSVYQTDIIYYGTDLPSYLASEFGVSNPFTTPDSPRRIELWGELAG